MIGCVMRNRACCGRRAAVRWLTDAESRMNQPMIGRYSRPVDILAADPAPTPEGGDRRYFLGALSASAASSEVGTSPPAAWAIEMSDSVFPSKTSSMSP